MRVMQVHDHNGYNGVATPAEARYRRYKKELHQQLIASMDLSAIGTLSGELAHDGDLPSGLVGALERLAPAVKARMAEQIAIVHDDEFAWFAKYALPVSARNRLDGNKTSESLWYEETLPPDTVMYCIVADRGSKPNGTERPGTEKLAAAIAGGKRYCQFGGNETLGQGWFQLTVV